MKTLNSFTLLTLTAALFAISSSTYAGEVQSRNINVRSRVVTFYDLDLAQPADAQTLLQRIRGTVKTVCRKSSVNTMDLYANIDVNRCMESSYRDTVAQVDRSEPPSRFNTDIEKIAGMVKEPRNLVSKR